MGFLSKGLVISGFLESAALLILAGSARWHLKRGDRWVFQTRSKTPSPSQTSKTPKAACGARHHSQDTREPGDRWVSRCDPRLHLPFKNSRVSSMAGAGIRTTAGTTESLFRFRLPKLGSGKASSGLDLLAFVGLNFLARCSNSPLRPLLGRWRISLDI